MSATASTTLGAADTARLLGPFVEGPQFQDVEDDLEGMSIAGLVEQGLLEKPP